jgi:hypothetical protein
MECLWDSSHGTTGSVHVRSSLWRTHVCWHSLFLPKGVRKGACSSASTPFSLSFSACAGMMQPRMACIRCLCDAWGALNSPRLTKHFFSLSVCRSLLSLSHVLCGCSWCAGTHSIVCSFLLLVCTLCFLAAHGGLESRKSYRDGPSVCAGGSLQCARRAVVFSLTVTHPLMWNELLYYVACLRTSQHWLGVTATLSRHLLECATTVVTVFVL